MKRVDLVIPTYNSPILLEHCLRSLLSSRYKAFNLIVVDDASDEPVREMVLSLFPDARVIRNRRRTGLVGVFNRGIESGNAEFVALLNDDTEVDPDWLHSLLAAAEKFPQAGSVASKIRLMRDRQVLHSAGDSYQPNALPVNRGVWLLDLGQYDSEELVFGACAGAALYRRSALNAAKHSNGDVFDSRLFMYCEDVDLNWRMQRLGFECVYAPNAMVFHHLSATGGGNLASYFVSRNIWLVKSRSVPQEIFTPYRINLFLTHLSRTISYFRNIREPAARAAIRGTIAGLVFSAFDRSALPSLETDEAERILGLLNHPSLASNKFRPGTPQQWD